MSKSSNDKPQAFSKENDSAVSTKEIVLDSTQVAQDRPDMPDGLDRPSAKPKSKKNSFCFAMVLVGCLLCLIYLVLRLWESGGYGLKAPEKSNAERETQLKREFTQAGKKQGKLLVMSISAQSTAFSIEETWFRTPFQVGIICQGKADVVIDLFEATIDVVIDDEGKTKLTVDLPPPKIDTSMIGIDLRDIKTVVDKRPKFRAQDEYERFREACKIKADEDFRSTLADLSVVEEAKQQAYLVLEQFYKACGADEINVVFHDEAEHILPSVAGD